MPPPDPPLPERAAQFRARVATLEAEIGTAIVGQPDVVRGVLTGLFTGGHILLEGVPGIAKTTLVSGPMSVAIDAVISGKTDDLSVTMTRSCGPSVSGRSRLASVKRTVTG